MDYREYSGLLERYKEVDSLTFQGNETKEEIIRRLIEVSREKKKIQTQNNEIIREYITKYEKEPERLDAEAQKQLQDFMKTLIQKNGQCIDAPIALRISRLLLRYYQKSGDLEQTIITLNRCSIFDIILKEHLDDYAGSEYPLMAERYLDDFDRLSEDVLTSLINCWFYSVINRKDMTFALKKYKEIRVKFEEIRRKKGEDFMWREYVLCKENALGFTLEACRRWEYARKRGVPASEPVIDPQEEADAIAELAGDLRAVLESEEQKDAIYDKVVAWLYCIEADYHLGRITLEELLDRLEEYLEPHEEYNAMEQCSALFTAGSYYLDYLCKCSRYEEEYILKKSMEIVERVLKKAKDMEQYLGDYQTNYCVLMLVNSASAIVDFDSFQHTVLSATIYANKALYVHTMMVKEISCVLLDYILEHNAGYVDGVGGYAGEDTEAYRSRMMGLMEKCVMFHDIGKYFCLDYVSNSSRNLTDDEFEVIKEHPANFSKIYQGKMSRDVECVHDCALLHHLWYNEKGGYPIGKHTANQPFVNIISIADSIDAATDNIGRPYGQGKNLEQLLEEFDGMKDSRYSGYICELLHVEEVKAKIEYILDVRRREIYCDIYLKQSGA
ncbi:MAG: hypothetical protein NC389_15415 [Acetatifactor muris]|nr:hypothetical protein [Acetatifactor muris]